MLDFIGSAIDSQQISRGNAFDAFSGTASVGRYLKRKGFCVYACDLMTYSYVFQKALIEIDCIPQFDKLLSSDERLTHIRKTERFRHYLESRFELQEDLFAVFRSGARGISEVLGYLEQFLPDEAGFVSTHYSSNDDEAAAERMFFTRLNAQRIDAIRSQIEKWRRSNVINESEYYALLASLLDAADAVANTTGVYAAFVKTWQPNAEHRLRLEVPDFVVNTGRKCLALQGDVNQVISSVPPLDLLYLDPPYNTRQYSSYYHVPELIAKGWYDREPTIRGKTGLIEDTDKKSQWSTKGGCVTALEALLESANTKHVLMSYNSEGIISEADISRLLKSYGTASTYHVFELEYDRYRSDRDSEDRQYKTDLVTEKIYYVRR